MRQSKQSKVSGKAQAVLMSAAGGGWRTLERLEARQLLSGVVATVTGASTVNEGSNYALNLSVSNLGTLSVDHWTINWGDSQSTAAGSATEADHVYEDGPATFTVTAAATLSDQSVVDANVTTTTVTNPGQLDPSFGVDGKTITSFGANSGVATSTALLDNGQFVIAGQVGSGVTLVRYNADGSVDTSFGAGGQVVVPGLTGVASVLDEHVDDPNNPGHMVERLVVAGSENDFGSNSFHSVLVRLNLDDSGFGLADGSVDTTFGAGGTVQLPNFLPTHPSAGDNLFAATLSPSGQIVTEGMAWGGPQFQAQGEWLTVARINSDGSLDTSFNGTGEQAQPLGTSNVGPNFALIQPLGVVAGADGSVVALAIGQVGDVSGAQLMKFTSSGQVDNTFGTNGIAGEDPNTIGDTQFDAITLDASGNILLGGSLNRNNSVGFALARYSYSTGAIDTSFGSTYVGNFANGNAGESATFLSHNSNDGITSLQTTASGQIVAVGEIYADGFVPVSGTNDIEVARYNSDGSLDTSFGTSGLTQLDFQGGRDIAAGMAIQPDGRVLIAGYSFAGTVGSTNEFTAARLGQISQGTATPVVVNVLNVAPTATILNAPATVAEGTAVNLSSTVTDPSPVDTAAGFSDEWTVTKNGNLFENGGGTNLTNFSFTPDDNGTYVVTLSATDKDNGVSNLATVTINAFNVPPTATITTAPTTGNEGSPITLAGSATDPSTVDTAAGLPLTWAVTKNGNAFSTGSGASYTFTPDDNGTYVVTLTATDKDGGMGTATDTIAVANVAPTATITTAPTTGNEGSPITLAGSATDPSTVDTAAGLPLTWAVTKNGNAFATGSGASYTFTPDDNGTYVVTLTATDKDGGMGTATDTIAVANVAPTATITTAPTTGNEGSPITLAGSATDPSTVDTAAGLPLTWAVTKNGNAFATGSGASYTFTPDDNGTYVVTLTATDKDGGMGTATDTIAVANVAPTATINSPPTTGVEGTAIALTGSATDPSTVDTAAGLLLGWTVTKNGNAFSPTVTGSSFSFTPNDNGTYVVTLSATDKDGGVGTATDTIIVANVAPIVGSIAAPAKDVRFQTATFTDSFSDPGPLDTHVVTWNFGDGSPVVSTSLAAGVTGAVSASHAFASTGSFTVTLTVTDKDGGVGTTSQSFTVDAADLQTDPTNPAKTALFVGGTSGAAAITVTPGSNNTLTATINNTNYTGFAPTGRVVIFGGPSANVIQVSSSITLPSEIYGGNGGNLIKGGGGPNIEVGGTGIDVLVAGNARDILVGGGGSDLLVAGSGNDLMVAMSLTYDSVPTAMEAIQKEWIRTDISVAQQVTDLTQGGGLNGSVVISAATAPNDDDTDILVGGSGSDVFVVDNGDLVLNATKKDTTVDLSWITV